ncbi:ABC transporter ATP-binding protein [Collinsella sp. AGMB00827]|uniref:ABC transporter ATP-binding protein n=1 Tax=Collinsella ureilytica TaxID=2869515 RepID=A0ABS7MIT1_9ACTN|nr:ABC transporter ATP-binding protein [Collinsella urealyticum]MBY4797279.1 ABC transporter ATP-binding protein [Collinsella urealyticum]
MSQLEVQHVSQTLGGVNIIEDICITVQAGSIACLLGPSGCGKTTLFHIIAGLATPYQGTIVLDGKEITGTPGKLAYMLQKDLLLAHKTILANVALPLLLRGVPKCEAYEHARSLFGVFGLEGTDQRWPSELSGGMRQRVALLRSYLFNNDFMLLDEPFSALDAFTKADMHRWFLQVAEELGTTALVVTHDIDEAVLLSDRMYVMRGAPQRGIPTCIAGEVEIAHPRSDRKDFGLSEDFILAKRSVMELLRADQDDAR